VRKIIHPPNDIAGEKVSSFCHGWSQDGNYLVITYDRVLCLYDRQFQLLSTFSLDYITTSLNISSPANSEVFQIAIGTNFGAQVIELDLRDIEAPTISDKPISTFFENTPIACVSFGACSSEILVLAIATIDGRVGIWNLKGVKQILSATLSAPRITDIQFSPTKDRVAFATRKGNVYLFQYSPSKDTWTLVDACHEMVNAPKCEGRACSTLVTWWGQSPFLVVASRDGNACLEVFDTISGEVCHRFRLIEKQKYHDFSLKQEILDTFASSKPKKDNGYSITGFCCLVLPKSNSRNSAHQCSHRQRLLCFDTSARLWLLSWDFVDVLYQ
jgi:WD40 repeat protein